MIDTKAIEDAVKKLCEAIPPSFQNIKNDLEKNFRSILQSTFNKLDLVTREEFDAQAGVLAKTRAKLEKMEKQIVELESQLLKKKHTAQEKTKK